MNWGEIDMYKYQTKVIILLVLIVLMTAGCGYENQDIAEEESDPVVDIWNSINYKVITDPETIKKFDPSTEGSVLLNFSVRIENRGKERAKSFSMNFNPSKPYKFVDGSVSQGIDNGSLDSNKRYELYGYYIFNTKSDFEEFIENSSISISWVEDERNKEIILRLPSKPTQ